MPRRNRRKHSKSEGTLGFNPYKYIVSRDLHAYRRADENRKGYDGIELMVRHTVYSDKSSLDRQHRHKTRRLSASDHRLIRSIVSGLQIAVEQSATHANADSQGKSAERTHVEPESGYPGRRDSDNLPGYPCEVKNKE